MHGRFVPDAGAALDSPPRIYVDYHFRRAGDPVDGLPELIINGTAYPLPNTLSTLGQAYGQFLRLVFDNVCSHFLFHAGAVANEDGGILVVGDSFYGKTTLVLELVRRGFRFLSDELAALDRKNGWVSPFPRSLHIRPGTLGMMDVDVPSGNAFWYGKAIVDVDDVAPQLSIGPVPVKHIVVLADTASAGDRHPSDDVLVVVANAMTAAVVDEIFSLSQVESIQQDTDDAAPALRIQSSYPKATLIAVEDICRKHGILILDYHLRDVTVPRFGEVAHLQEISHSQTVIELLRRFQPGHRSSLLQSEFGGHPTKMFIELLRLIEPAQCHQLTIGPIAQNADLVAGLAT